MMLQGESENLQLEFWNRWFDIFQVGSVTGVLVPIQQVDVVLGWFLGGAAMCGDGMF